MAWQLGLPSSGWARTKVRKRKGRDKVGLDCLLLTRPGEGVYIQLFYISLELRGRVKTSAKAVVLPATDPRDDIRW